ncbi:MAG: hypothetical protein K2G40_07950 [Muribaculaceae bacterium]|nr:hypothetical protein [Muribaculaceae bacterium]
MSPAKSPCRAPESWGFRDLASSRLHFSLGDINVVDVKFRKPQLTADGDRQVDKA